MEYKDYCRTLGVGEQAEGTEIKRACRRVGRRFHPGVTPSNQQVEAQLKEINEAHEVLSAPDKRHKYQRVGASWQVYPRGIDWGGRAAAGQGSRPVRVGYVDTDDIFSGGGFSNFLQFVRGVQGLFRGSSASSRRLSRGRDVEQPVDCILKRVFRMPGGSSWRFSQ